MLKLCYLYADVMIGMNGALWCRPLQIVNGEKMHAVEMTSLYYDNAKMRPMAYNLAMNTSMWTGIVTTDNAFRNYQSRIYPTLQGKPFFVFALEGC